MTYSDEMTLEQARRRLREQVAVDDSKTHCPCCGLRVRDDKKGITRWMAEALIRMAAHVEASQDNGSPVLVVHLATLLAGTPAVRDHGYALLRHWNFIREEPRPLNAGDEQKGSRGLTGWYSITQRGWDVLCGATFPKNIVRKFGTKTWTLEGPQITLVEALKSEVLTDDKNKVIDGTTVCGAKY
jgi:hypothetical protein